MTGTYVSTLETTFTKHHCPQEFISGHLNITLNATTIEVWVF